jgi:hypothetical protein
MVWLTKPFEIDHAWGHARTTPDEFRISRGVENQGLRPVEKVKIS